MTSYKDPGMERQPTPREPPRPAPREVPRPERYTEPHPDPDPLRKPKVLTPEPAKRD